jgi:REP element-mobilizing transposase RayT
MTHVHLVVDADPAPERVMNDLKSYASRILNQQGLDNPHRNCWSRHGSTRWLRNRKVVEAAVRYVIEAQGPPMCLYQSPYLSLPESTIKAETEP